MYCNNRSDRALGKNLNQVGGQEHHQSEACQSPVARSEVLLRLEYLKLTDTCHWILSKGLFRKRRKTSVALRRDFFVTYLATCRGFLSERMGNSMHWTFSSCWGSPFMLHQSSIFHFLHLRSNLRTGVALGSHYPIVVETSKRLLPKAVASRKFGVMCIQKISFCFLPPLSVLLRGGGERHPKDSCMLWVLEAGPKRLHARDRWNVEVGSVKKSLGSKTPRVGDIPVARISSELYRKFMIISQTSCNLW